MTALQGSFDDDAWSANMASPSPAHPHQTRARQPARKSSFKRPVAKTGGSKGAHRVASMEFGNDDELLEAAQTAADDEKDLDLFDKADTDTDDGDVGFAIPVKTPTSARIDPFSRAESFAASSAFDSAFDVPVSLTTAPTTSVLDDAFAPSALDATGSDGAFPSSTEKTTSFMAFETPSTSSDVEAPVSFAPAFAAFAPTEPSSFGQEFSFATTAETAGFDDSEFGDSFTAASDFDDFAAAPAVAVGEVSAIPLHIQARSSLEQAFGGGGGAQVTVTMMATPTTKFMESSQVWKGFKDTDKDSVIFRVSGPYESPFTRSIRSTVSIPSLPASPLKALAKLAVSANSRPSTPTSTRSSSSFNIPIVPNGGVEIGYTEEVLMAMTMEQLHAVLQEVQGRIDQLSNTLLEVLDVQDDLRQEMAGTLPLLTA